MKNLLLSSLLLCTFHAHAWGPLGHRIVGQLAENRLSPAAKEKLRSILGKDTLADVSTWADFVRSDPKWRHAEHWHYVSVEDGKKYRQDPPSPNGDVVASIKTFVGTLADKAALPERKREAVAWLVHLVGDVHQPLHVGKAGDMGGNKVSLKWMGKKTSLHWIWDKSLLEMEQLSYTEYVRYIDKTTPEQEKEWAAAPIPAWLDEAIALRPLIYDYPKKLAPYWEYQYAFKALPVVHERLLKAGVRLATTLEWALTGKTAP